MASRRRAPKVVYRERARRGDLASLRRLVGEIDVFSAEERKVAVELLEERLTRGRASGYEFYFAALGTELVGYCTWGDVPLTRASYDLYWIAVAPKCRGLGIGRRLLREAEAAVARRGGGQLYVETSSRAIYASTRRFYRGAGYRQIARFANFYAPGDHKIVFCKTIAKKRRSRRVRSTSETR
jgi:ribosomal protein S18 acetylase RimI-like enzyme